MWFVLMSFTHEIPTVCQPFLGHCLSTLREPLSLSNGSVGNKALLVLNPKGKMVIMDLGDFNSRLKGHGL